MGTKRQTIRMEGTLCLSPAELISNDELEEVSEEVLEVLDGRPEIIALTQGVGVGVNFREGRIEIAMILEGITVMELQQQVLTIVAALDSHCSLNIADIPSKRQPKAEATPRKRVELLPTSTQFAYA